jgi:perosamine synthetase
MQKFIKQIQPVIDGNEERFIKKIVKTTFITENKFSKEFEEKIRKKVNAKYAIVVNNWTSGLYCCAKALNLKKNDEILVPNITFASSVSSMLLANLKVVLCEIDENDYSINLKLAEKLISKKTKAIMIVHLFGECSNIEETKSFARKHKLKIIEDAAQAFGGKYKQKALGTFGDVGGYSFYGNKSITTGEGGIAITNNRSIAQKIRKLKNYGRLNKGTYRHSSVGYNFKFTDLNAAIGLAQLKKINKIFLKKKFIDDFYRTKLGHLKEIKFSNTNSFSEPIYWFTVIRAKKKNSLSRYLLKKRIETRDFFLPMHLQSCFKKDSNVLNKNQKFTTSVKLYKTGLCLPSSANITKSDLNYVVKMIIKFYEHRN